jgi:pyruvate dehydrogenase E1 component alpha subunit
MDGCQVVGANIYTATAKRICAMVTIDVHQASGRHRALERMVLLREFESTAAERFTDGEIPGFLHPYIGQEAVAVGACAALESEDYITSTHRGHGHCLAKGLDPSRMMAELYGKREGYCNGKGGSMHIADLDEGMLGANGIVGAGAPLATGGALTAHLKDESKVALSFFGDGAVAQGQLHEGINMAATWDLPAIFLAENNLYGEGTPAALQHNVEDLSRTAEAYGIPGEIVDGMDLTAVFDAVNEARERARAGEGPTFIEAKTYRFEGHFVGDPEPYREQSEVEEWRKRDPVTSFRDRLIESGELTEEEFEEIRAETAERIEEAVEFARNGEDPAPETAYEDVFVDPVPEIPQPPVDGGERR